MEKFGSYFKQESFYNNSAYYFSDLKEKCSNNVSTKSLLSLKTAQTAFNYIGFSALQSALGLETSSFLIGLKNKVTKNSVGFKGAFKSKIQTQNEGLINKAKVLKGYVEKIEKHDKSLKLNEGIAKKIDTVNDQATYEDFKKNVNDINIENYATLKNAVNGINTDNYNNLDFDPVKEALQNLNDNSNQQKKADIKTLFLKVEDLNKNPSITDTSISAKLTKIVLNAGLNYALVKVANNPKDAAWVAYDVALGTANGIGFGVSYMVCGALTKIGLMSSEEVGSETIGDINSPEDVTM